MFVLNIIRRRNGDGGGGCGGLGGGQFVADYWYVTRRHEAMGMAGSGDGGGV